MKRSLTMTTAAALTGLTLFVTACTGGGGENKGDKKDSAGGSSAGQNAGTDSGKVADDALKVRQCLRKQGIDVPDPEPGQDPRGLTLGSGADPQKMQKAMEACGMQGPGSGKGPTQEQKDKELKWVQCMRKNGVNLPDPTYQGSARSAIEIPKGQEKAFEEAQKKCETA
ncbi:hypothetical protein DEJ50_13970 [Streptomyces venezuelae]|uniref:Secreted protein n=1 Tax=Streptomyces venezuelae TaxID=54571 RepID=A0A5P2D0U9_STRVZ|nr:hypothetical protein [Streptomyces venezuelae]QES48762.1 hypothetical protein DEJ50_13970 [Streptomyces venezuelae]